MDTFLSAEESYSIWSIVSITSWGKAADSAHMFLMKNESSFQYSLLLHIKIIRLEELKRAKKLQSAMLMLSITVMRATLALGQRATSKC